MARETGAAEGVAGVNVTGTSADAAALVPPGFGFRYSINI